MLKDVLKSHNNIHRYKKETSKAKHQLSEDLCEQSDTHLT
jgi:hypothetical protein